ncbi:MAG: hypothetical protein IJV82_05115 [Oscillospiraceae bacterium]|nr:hypothetical protein [Oscillospiraceae bacterium]
MANEKRKRIHLIYGCILSVLLILMGIALITSCLDIYNSGDKPYTPESVVNHFHKISPLIYLTIAAIVGGIILNLAIPLPQSRPKAIRDNYEALIRLRSKVDALNPEYDLPAKQEQKKRRSLQIISAVVCVLLCIHPLVYFCNQQNFVGTVTDCVVKAMILCLSYAFVVLLVTFACKLVCQKSVSKEIEIYKKAIAEKAYSPAAPGPKNISNEKMRIFVIRAIVVSVAFVFIVLGIFNGGAEAVLSKANAICMECIGMG